MGNETKNFTTVTFSCRGERYHEIRGHEMGMPMFDWIREKAPVETDRLTRVLEGALEALYQRSRSGIREERGLVNPYLFIINEADGVKLLDLCDQSNMAVVRKSRTGTAMRCFSPSDMTDDTLEEAEIYGFARLCQFMLAENDRAGEECTGKAARRYQRFIDRCTGEGARPVTDFVQAQKAFGRVLTAACRDEKGDSGQHGQVLYRILVTAAVCLTVVFLYKKAVLEAKPERESLKTENIRISRQVERLEKELAVLEEEQDQIRQMVKN